MDVSLESNRTAVSRWAASCRALFEAAWKSEQIDRAGAQGISRLAQSERDLLFEYVTRCGMGRPLLGALKPATRSDLVPAALLEELHRRATQDVVDDLIRREAITRVGAALRELGCAGILLKGAAFQVLGDPRNELPLRRATGDIDLYVEPPGAIELRRLLLQRGFEGSLDEPRTAPHHLAAVVFRGVAVEIHERIMPSFWGLPERELIAHSIAVAAREPLRTLSPEGLMLHAGMHASAHLFAQGLKTGWDLRWIQRRFPELDYDLLAAWIGACRLARGFWTPVQVLNSELELGLPARFLKHAPQDRHQLKLENFARDRIFSALEGPFDLNPFTKTWVIMLLHGSWPERIGYLMELARGSAAEARRSDRRNHPASVKLRYRQMTEALAQWRYYQRGARAAPRVTR